MPFKVIRLDNEPIIIARVFGYLTVLEQKALIRRIARLGDTFTGKIYRVVDATGKNTSFAEMLMLTPQELSGWAGTASDPRVITLAVSDEVNTLTAARVLRFTLGDANRVFLFGEVTEAIEAAREMHAAEVAGRQQPVPY